MNLLKAVLKAAAIVFFGPIIINAIGNIFHLQGITQMIAFPACWIGAIIIIARSDLFLDLRIRKMERRETEAGASAGRRRW